MLVLGNLKPGGMGTRAIGAALLLAFASACTTNSFRRSVNAFKKTVVPDSGSDAPSFQIRNVVRSTLDPNKSFDVVGDGSGILSTLCLPPPDDDENPVEGVDCSCHLEYERSDGETIGFDSVVTYFEPNYLRCSFSGVPKDVPFVKVSVRVNNTSQFSNEILYPLHGVGTTGDPTLLSNFVPAERYQCRDAIFIPNTMDPKIYDPFVSEDPRLVYPLNFYTTNMGGTLSWFASKVIPVNGAGWICPASREWQEETQDVATNQKRIFSQEPLEPFTNATRTAQKRIYPPAGSSFDRSTFYLAKTPVGVFTIPFNTFIAPGIPTQTQPKKAQNQDGSPGPIGYGATPYRMSKGQETCPDSTFIIPRGMKWVKVWQFRSTLEARLYKKNHLLGQIEIYCSPGTFPDGSAISQACGASGRSNRLDSVFRCFAPSIGRGTQVNDSVAHGTDLWSFIGVEPGARPCDIGDDPLGYCSQGSPFAPSNRFTADAKIDDTSRFDLLYVVTPTDVMTDDFLKETPKGRQYFPYRFYSAEDCLAENGDEGPIVGGSRDCDKRKRVPYSFVTHDASQEDPASDDQGRAFPVCALQPI